MPMFRDITRCPRQCLVSGHRYGVSRDMRIAVLIKVGHVGGSSGRHRGRGRGPFPVGCGSCLPGVPAVGQPAGRPLAGRGRGRVRAEVTTTQVITERDPIGRSRAGHPAAEATVRAGPRCRPAHHLLASGTPPDPAVHGDGAPDPDPARPGHTRTPEAPQGFLHPVRGRPAERDLADRLHPLPATRRPRRRGAELPRRPLPAAARIRRLPPGHRPGRLQGVPRNDCSARHPGQCPVR